MKRRDIEKPIKRVSDGIDAEPDEVVMDRRLSRLAPMAVTKDQARDAKPAALAAFRRVADVVGVGITRIDDSYALKVNIRRPPKANIVLPSEVNGVRVKVEVTGDISARD